MFVPIEFPEPSSETVESFGSGGADALMYAAFACDLLVISATLILVFMSAEILLFMSFNLPSQQVKVEYLRGSTKAIQIQAVTMYTELFVFAIEIFLRGLLASPKAGWAACIPLVGLSLWWAVWFNPNVHKCAHLALAE